MDVDAVIHASSTMKEAANRVGDKYNLPHGWLYSDFMRTNSYSPKLEQFSVYYKTFAKVLQVRTVSAVFNLYGSWDGFSADSVSFINDALEKGNYGVVYAAVMEEEKNSKDVFPTKMFLPFNSLWCHRALQEFSPLSRIFEKTTFLNRI